MPGSGSDTVQREIGEETQREIGELSMRGNTAIQETSPRSD
jgi:hypothetical protein